MNSMKVLMISGDRNVLRPGTQAYARIALQRSSVDRLDVYVWPQMHSLRDVFRAVQITTYEVVTSQDPFWRGVFSWRLAARTGAALNVQVHADLAGEPWHRRLIARFVLRRADSVRAVSEKVRAQVLALCPAASVQVLPIYVDERFGRVVPKAHIGKNILWIGRFEKEKDPLGAIAVFDDARVKVPEAHLTMVGSGSLQAEVKRKAEGKPIKVQSWVADPLPLFETADVVLSTSAHESWGASMVEALAAGIPVVAPDVGIAREAGAVVVRREELAEALVNCLRSGVRGKLTFPLVSKEEWVKRWRETLV